MNKCLKSTLIIFLFFLNGFWAEAQEVILPESDLKSEQNNTQKQKNLSNTVQEINKSADIISSELESNDEKKEDKKTEAKPESLTNNLEDNLDDLQVEKNTSEPKHENINTDHLMEKKENVLSSEINEDLNEQKEEIKNEYSNSIPNLEGNEQDGFVEIETYKDQFGPYKERRNTSGFLFNITAENFKPNKFTSKIDGLTFEQIFEGSLPVGEIEVAYKYNFLLGSLALGLGYGGGSLSSGDYTLAIVRKKAFASYHMDNLFSEPYVVPYVKYAIVDGDVKEKMSNTSKESNLPAGKGTAISAGLLFQLNWLDEAASLSGRTSSGIQNSFLDIHVAKFTEYNDPEDVDISTDYIFGAGISIEF